MICDFWVPKTEATRVMRLRHEAIGMIEKLAKDLREANHENFDSVWFGAIGLRYRN